LYRLQQNNRAVLAYPHWSLQECIVVAVGRPRAFNDETALDRAIDCFWSQGFGGTTVRELARDMGINGPSLYNAFGDKRELFALALERYAERTTRDRIARLAALPDPRAALCQFFEEVLGRSLVDADCKGCLLVNAALEVAAQEPELRDRIAGYFREIEDFFRDRIMRARNGGLIAADVDPNEAATLLLSTLLGLRVMARLNVGPEALRAVSRAALAAACPVPTVS
jgi:TetR/AcrR family transcriptional repressor of nem operon